MKETIRFEKILLISSLIVGMLIAAAQVSIASAAQADTDIIRPKIALVLGGGGARGAAHVGIIKVLEENNVPIDLIIGTSMGSIIGGLYAAGYSPDELDQLMNDIDWGDLFTDQPSEEYLSFRRKKDQLRLMRIEMGITKDGITFKRGVISGQKFGFLLKKLTIHKAHINNFDELNIPFRAIAADLETGEVVVIGKGSLNEAIRASLSLPGIFPPIEIDGRTLVDGGIVNNVPIEVAKELGADIIIAVDVGTPLDDIENVKSALDVSMQSMGILGKRNVDESLALLTDKDLFIRPELGDIKTESFSRAPDAVDLGEQAALQVVDKIKRYSVSDLEFEKFLAKQRAKEFKPITIDFIKIKDLKRTHKKTVKGRLKTKPGDKLDFDKLYNDLTRVYSMGHFETVNFKIIEENNKTGLLIEATEKQWGPNYLKLGVNMSSDSDGDSGYTLLADYRMTQLNELGGEWKNVISFGETRGIFSEFYQPLDVQNYFFVAPFVNVSRRLEAVYSGDRRIAEYRVDQLRGGLDLGINFSSLAEGRIGIVKGVLEAKPEIGGLSLPKFESVEEAAIVAKLEYDQLNNHNFPKTGIQFKVALFASNKDMGADLSYENLEMSFIKATTLGSKHTVLCMVRASTSLDEDTPFYDQFTLGGFFSLSGLGENQLRGQHKGLGSLIYYYKFGNKSLGMASKLHLGVGMEMGNVWDDKDDIDFNDLILSGTVFVGIDNILGPIYLGYGLAEGTSEGRFYFFLGKTF